MVKTLVRDAGVCEEVPTPEKHKEEGFEETLATAEKLLGYRASRALIEEQTSVYRRLERSNEIREALRKLDDPPFVPSSVSRYKKKMLWKVVSQAQRLAVIFGAAFLLGLAASCICAVSSGLLWLTGSFFAVAIFEIGMQLTVFTFTCVLAALSTTFGTKDFFHAAWQNTPISAWAKPIPEFALQTAIDLKKKFGDDVEFYVEDLTVTRIQDPFLRVDLPDGSQYYLEVWLEPEFNGKRMV